MEKELENNLEETPTTADTLIEKEVAGEVVNENVVENIQETEDSKVDNLVSETKPLDINTDGTNEVETQKKSKKRILQGVVVSNKSDKTIIIKVIRQIAHPLYKKYYKKSNKFMANDPNNDCNIGDVVNVKESRPLSKRKRWELIEIVNKAK